MKKILILLFVFALTGKATAQETIFPAPPQSGTIALVHATIHVGNGEIIEDGMIVFSAGKIVDVRKYAPIADVTIIDCTGKQIYPGLIAPDTNLGLSEFSSIRSTNDEEELGDINPNIRSIVAYNADSKVIDNTRSNGVLLASIVPQGGIISGTSSIVQLDAWNWEDAIYQLDGGIHFDMPSLARYSTKNEPAKDAMEKIETVRNFLRQAQAYSAESKHEHHNLKFESVKGLFNKSKIFFVHCDGVKEMMIAVEFAKEFGFKTVIIGGNDSYKITDYLKQNNIAVILGETNRLPEMQDDDVDMPFKTPYLLQKAGVIYCISDANKMTRFRNLAFNAGLAVGYGLTKEQALEAITLNTAKILGIADRTGSLEKGKDANIVVSDGDILDIISNNIIYAFIQGRQINLDNKQKQLYEKYKYKYGLK